MKNNTISKMALPALMMSALMFQLLPGSVRVLGMVSIPEAAYNFFSLPMDHPAALCLPLAGMITVAAFILSMVATFSKNHPVFKATAWCALCAAALSAAPYIVQAEDIFLQPNVIVIILLTGCWLIAMNKNKKKDTQQGTEATGPRL